MDMMKKKEMKKKISLTYHGKGALKFLKKIYIS
jgi:hypothetical protein